MSSTCLRNCLLLLALPATLAAQITPPQAAHAYTAAHQPQLLQQFEGFLAIPNVAADPAGLAKNAAFLVGQLQQRGVTA